jgi:hypothetical protein
MTDFLWGLWNGITAWPLLIVHVFGWLDQYPVLATSRATAAGTSSAI